MKLYLTPHACSLAIDIVARELGIPLDLEWVDVRAKRLRDGSDYFAVNPKGQVPTLELPDGQRLTEGPVIVPSQIRGPAIICWRPRRAWSDIACWSG
jgi:glutathione S-transferase